MFHKMKYDLKGHPIDHIRPLWCQNNSSTFVYYHEDTMFSLNYIGSKIHFYFMKRFCDLFCFKTFWHKYNLHLRSYGQLISLFYLILTAILLIRWYNLFVYKVDLKIFKALNPLLFKILLAKRSFVNTLTAIKNLDVYCIYLFEF